MGQTQTYQSIQNCLVHTELDCFMCTQTEQCSLQYIGNTEYIYDNLYPPTFCDGYCSTVQGLLDWFEVDLGFT